MRYLRAFVGVVGASGSIIAAGGILVAVFSMAFAFHGWPDVRSARGPGIGAIELADGGAARAGGRIAEGRHVTTLPAVPVALVRRATRGIEGRQRHRRAQRRGPSTVARPTHGRGGDGTSTAADPSVDPAPGAAAPNGGGGTGPGASGGGGVNPSSGGSGATGSAAPDSAAPSPPPAPVSAAPSTPPSGGPTPAAGVTDAAAQAVQDTTQAAGGVVAGATSSAAQAVGPVAPAVAGTVTQVGATVDQTLTGLGQVVGGVLGGLSRRPR